MKKIITSALVLMSATAAAAGTIVYTAPEVVNMEEPARMGGSGAWLIPLIITTILLLAVSKDNGATVQPNGQN